MKLRNGLNDINNDPLVQEPSTSTEPRHLTMHEQAAEVARISAMRVLPAVRGRGRGGRGRGDRGRGGRGSGGGRRVYSCSVCGMPGKQKGHIGCDPSKKDDRKRRQQDLEEEEEEKDQDLEEEEEEEEEDISADSSEEEEEEEESG